MGSRSQIKSAYERPSASLRYSRHREWKISSRGATCSLTLSEIMEGHFSMDNKSLFLLALRCLYHVMYVLPRMLSACILTTTINDGDSWIILNKPHAEFNSSDFNKHCLRGILGHIRTDFFFPPSLFPLCIARPVAFISHSLYRASRGRRILRGVPRQVSAQSSVFSIQAEGKKCAERITY